MYITTYRKTVRKRKGPQAGQLVTVHGWYTTKGPSSIHAQLLASYPGETYLGGQLFEVVQGSGEYIVLGGKLLMQKNDVKNSKSF